MRQGIRPLAWGIAAACLYLAAVAFTFHTRLIPVRPLYDGLLPPPPYRYVSPPIEFIGENEPAQGGTALVKLTESGSEPGSVATGDGQAVVTLSTNMAAPRAGESAIRVAITPLDPRRVAPAELRDRVDGNGYRVEMVYAGSGARVELLRPFTVVLRYPVHATEIWQSGQPGWQALPTTYFPTSFVVYAESRQLGTFVGVAPAGYWSGLTALRRRPLREVILQSLSLVLVLIVLIGLVVSRRTRARRAT